MSGNTARPRVLCLDGGGIRGLSEILILKELMLQVRVQNGLDYTPEPRQCFDVVFGTSTGGLAALLLGRLGKSLDDCERVYRSFGAQIFSGGSAKKSARMAWTGSKHSGERLAAVVRGEAGQEIMYEPTTGENGHIPVAVIAVASTTNEETLFRTYGDRASIQKCPVVDACLATAAATTFFPPVTIDGIEYIDGAFRRNNPTMAAINELESEEWLSQMCDAVAGVECMVSVGTGRHTYQNAPESSSLVPEGVKSAKDAVKRCVQIAMNCHNVHLEVERMFQRANAADCYYRLDVDKGLEFVKMNESDEDTLQHISAVTKAYLQEHHVYISHCAKLLCPRPESEAAGLSSSRTLICSGLPDITETFYGRERELRELYDGLDPAFPGRKSVLLHGMGGSGKTQLARRHIQQVAGRYSAVIWIQATNPADAAYSVSETIATMENSWPRDLPMLRASADTADTIRLATRLRSTRYQNWLLVIDSADDLDDSLQKYVPECQHGSVLVTSTRLRSCRGFKPLKVVVEGLDLDSSLELLGSVSGHPVRVSDEHGLALDVVKELSGIPLAIEQSGALIRLGEYTFEGFLNEYRGRYRELMSNIPDETEGTYEKRYVISAILDMTFRAAEKHLDSALLLLFLGVMGSWRIPIHFLEGITFCRLPLEEGSKVAKHVDVLGTLLRNRNLLRVCLRRLSGLCLVRLEEENGAIRSVWIHRILCQWSLETLSSDRRPAFIIQAAHALSMVVCCLELERQRIAKPYWDDYRIQNQYLAPFINILSLASSLPPTLLDARCGDFRFAYGDVVQRGAFTQLSMGRSTEALGSFRLAIEFESARQAEKGLQWPSGHAALGLLCGFSVASAKEGDTEESVEALRLAVDLAETSCGHDSLESVWTVSLLKKTEERRETLLQHHKSAVVASTSQTDNRAHPKASEGRSTDAEVAFSDHSDPEASVDDDPIDSIDANDATIDLWKAAAAGNLPFVQLLLGIPGVNPDAYDPDVGTALELAIRKGHVDVAIRLIETKKVDVNRTYNRMSVRRTSSSSHLASASLRGQESIVTALLDAGAYIHGNGTTADNVFGPSASFDSPAAAAISGGHTHILRLLMDRMPDAWPEYELRLASVRNPEAFRFLVSRGAHLDSEVSESVAALLSECLTHAVRTDEMATVRLILGEEGSLPKFAAGVKLEGAFFAAANTGNNKVVRILLDLGVLTRPWTSPSANHFGNNGGDYEPTYTVSIASKYGHISTVQLLLDNGVPVNCVRGDRVMDLFDLASYLEEPIREAIKRGHLDIVKLLIERGAVVDEEHAHAAEFDGNIEIADAIRDQIRKGLPTNPPGVAIRPRQSAIQPSPARQSGSDRSRQSRAWHIKNLWRRSGV